MGKSGSSCLKIITCVGDPEEDGDLEAVEGKAGKRKWSFRKRSTSRRVLSNNAMMETVTATMNGKDNSEIDSSHYCAPTIAAVSEKSPVVKFVEEAPPIPLVMLRSEVSDSLPDTKSTEGSDSVIEESAAIMIQTVIRVYLAEKVLMKIKNVVKLQAAVRGHLVRKQAVGTLRCVQAIVKMQALVRARHMRRNVGKLLNEEAFAEKLQVKEGTKKIQNIMYSSTEKLLTNGFARQLLESTPSRKTKSIHISCDPSRSESAWKWLERWMTVTSSVVGPQQELHPDIHIQELKGEAAKVDTAETLDVPIAIVPPAKLQGEAVKRDTSEILADVQVDSVPLLEDATPDLGESEIPAACLVTNKPDLNESEAPMSPTKIESSLHTRFDQQQSSNSGTKDIYESNSGQISVESEVNLQPDSLSERHVVDMDMSRHTTKRLVGLREIEGKKFGFGLKKTCNPAFAAAQSKFEELSAVPSSDKSVGPLHDIAHDKKSDTFTPQSLLSVRPDVCFTENSSTLDTKVQSATSECGTEISISSTLDSPDRSEAEGGEIILEINGFGRMDYVATASAHDACNFGNANPEPNISSAGTLQETNLDETDGNSGKYMPAVGNSVGVEHSLAGPAASNMLPLKPAASNMLAEEPALADAPLNEPTTPNVPPKGPAALDAPPKGPAASDALSQLEEATAQQTYRSSPEGSPVSHLTAAELHGTPSSGVSANAKESKISDSLPSMKQKFQLTGKRSPVDSNTESGARSAAEHLPKDNKNVKRRNSLGIAKPDHGDFEPRFSSSNSLPSYMQATQSAKAKVNAGNSPKASPDVHDKDSHARKRHSLPFGNGKQVSSPRMQRFTSQAQQSLKGIGTRSPHTLAERKWQR